MSQPQTNTFPIFDGPNPGENYQFLPDAPPWRNFAPTAAGMDTALREAPPLSARDRSRAETFYFDGMLRPPSANHDNEGQGNADTPRESVTGAQGNGTETSAEPRQDIRLTVSAALALRRPLLVLGNPGTGKSTLAYAIARDLGLGAVLRWNINSRTTLKDGLYSYDAIGRLNDVSLYDAASPNTSDGIPGIGEFITLGPLGTALLPTFKQRPRVLIIDELDKSDIDLPNDLLNVFEEGYFEIPELVRDKVESAYVRPWDYREVDERVSIHKGRIACTEFPVVVITSNGEREFSAAFKRRCLRLRFEDPNQKQLEQIAHAHLGKLSPSDLKDILSAYERNSTAGYVATDQLLNALYLLRADGVAGKLSEMQKDTLRTIMLEAISRTGEN